eukprot:7198288-Alexandrium_andersonii.AAC.1
MQPGRWKCRIWADWMVFSRSARLHREHSIACVCDNMVCEPRACDSARQWCAPVRYNGAG